MQVEFSLETTVESRQFKFLLEINPFHVVLETAYLVSVGDRVRAVEIDCSTGQETGNAVVGTVSEIIQSAVLENYPIPLRSYVLALKKA